VTRKELQSLSRIRLREARALAKLGMSDGAYYLAGYCVECALKACIARATQRHELPDKKKVDASHTHSLRELLKVAGLAKASDQEGQRDAIFRDNWDTIFVWSERSRYGFNDTKASRELMDAVAGRNHGVLRWIKQHW
jgi:hypothetical protein